MRILRVPTDFRVVEQFDEAMLTRQGDHLIYSVSTRGLSTGETLGRLAEAAGVDAEAVAAAAQKPREGVSGQVVSIRGGEPLALRDRDFTVRRLGVAQRAVQPEDITGNAYEVVVRDLCGDDMRRLRHNLAQVRGTGLPNYFDDQRFGCLRHGQGYIVRDLLRGRPEQALRALLAAPSPYGPPAVERYKDQIRRNWGDWPTLIKISNGRRGKSAFEHLAAHEGDFLGAMRVGVATRERTMHLYAFQSHLFNRALAARVRQLVEGEARGWLPCDEGSLPVWRELPAEQRRVWQEGSLWLPGEGMPDDPETQRLYRPIFEAEGISLEDFCALDVPGFRPLAEPRPLLMQPEYLRAAPAQEDEYYPRSRKMRVRFTLPRGQYATLVLKRLLMPTEPGARRLCLWVSRHPLVWPTDDGTPQVFERSSRAGDEERPRTRPPRRESGSEGGGGSRGGPRRPWGNRDARREDSGRRDSPWKGRR